MPAPSRILDHARPSTYLNKTQRLDPRQNPFTGIPWENWANAALVDPKITALSPSTLAATASATTITVTGSGFGAGSIVEADGVALSTTFGSTTSLTCTFDPSVAGTVNFTVRNVSGMESNDFPFIVTGTVEMDPATNPENFTIVEIQEWTDLNPDWADEVLAREEARGSSARVTLLDWLRGFIEHRDA